MSMLHGKFNRCDRVNNFDPYSILYKILYQTKIDLDYAVVGILNTQAEIYLLESKEDLTLQVAVNITEMTAHDRHRVEENLNETGPYASTCYYLFPFDNLDEKIQLFNPYYKNIKETLYSIREIPYLLEKQQIECSLLSIDELLVASQENGEKGQDKQGREKGKIKI